jgi:hypothetical protein
MRQQLERCGRNIHWLFLAVGIPLALIGGMFTATIVGAIIGIPLLLLAWPLLANPVEVKACA